MVLGLYKPPKPAPRWHLSLSKTRGNRAFYWHDEAFAPVVVLRHHVAWFDLLDAETSLPIALNFTTVRDALAHATKVRTSRGC